jgi:hypothetical protein
MALSQDEQRMLAEIERRLASDDPGLATCLTSFRRPGPGTVLRSPRARIIGSLFTVLLVAMISLMVYAMIPFRTHMTRPPTPTAGTSSNTVGASTAGAPSHTAIWAAQPNAGHQSSAGTGGKSTASQTTTNRSTRSTTAGKKQQANIKPTNGTIVSDAP